MDTKAVVSFSGGKDCTLALHRALQSGYDVQRLFTTMNAENNRSWVHGTHQDVLTKIGDALGLPIDVVSTNFWTAGYATDFEKQLATYKEGVLPRLFLVILTLNRIAVGVKSDANMLV